MLDAKHKTLRFADFAGARIERIFVNETMREAIRFAAMKDGETMYLRPLDLPEDELVVLIGDAVAAKVFSERFLSELRDILDA